MVVKGVYTLLRLALYYGCLNLINLYGSLALGHSNVPICIGTPVVKGLKYK